MKKFYLLTKTLLVAALLMVGANAWGEEVLINYPTSKTNINYSGTTADTECQVAGDKIPCYQLKNGYTTSSKNNGNTIRFYAEGGFKAGDVITIAGVINTDQADRHGTVVLFSGGFGKSTTTIKTFEDFVNVNGNSNTPVEQSYTLTADVTDSLYLGRSGNTGTNVTMIKIVRPYYYNGVLVHTASNSCGSDKNAFTNTVDNATEKYYQQGSQTNQGYAFAEYSYTIPAGYLIKNATLSWSATNLNTNSARTSSINYLNAGKTIDYENMPTTTSLRFHNEKTWIKDVATAAGVSAISDVTDVTAAVKAMQAQGYIIFQWTNIAGGANLNGKGASAALQPKLLIELESISEYIAAHKGDLTGLINGDFTTNADGWTGGSRITGLARGWSSSSDENPFYERSSDGALSYTLSNMPAGTYKVVAAARGYAGGQITPQIAGTTGATLNTVGDARTSKSKSEINLNGVEMPYSELGGFTTNSLGHNWKWITATGTLAEAGDLVINFNCVGNSWMPIDDVHLYCTSLGGTSYTTTVTEGSAVSNSDGKVVTCDIVLANPNSIITSNEAITTASGAALNNNLVGTNIAQLVLYDGADYTFSMSSAGTYTINNSYGAAKFYRSLTENTYCTICLPFTPAAGSGTYYEPTKLSDGSLTISEVADADLKPNTPYILKPSGNYNDIWNNNNAENEEKYNVKYTDNQPATEVDGGKMWFTGRLEKQSVLGSLTDDYYVLGTDNELHKISDEGTVTVNPFRAYFYVAGGSGARGMTLVIDDEILTGINEAEAATEAVAKEGKFFENGKLIIFKKGMKFNANGQVIK